MKQFLKDMLNMEYSFVWATALIMVGDCLSSSMSVIRACCALATTELDFLLACSMLCARRVLEVPPTFCTTCFISAAKEHCSGLCGSFKHLALCVTQLTHGRLAHTQLNMNIIALPTLVTPQVGFIIAFLTVFVFAMSKFNFQQR